MYYARETVKHLNDKSCTYAKVNLSMQDLGEYMYNAIYRCVF